jgi:hypothetical protein
MSNRSRNVCRTLEKVAGNGWREAKARAKFDRDSEEDAGVQVTAILTPAEEGGFTVFNPETGSTTQGETLDEALSNLREAVELYLEEFP